jgi:carbon storage regulator
VGFSNDVGVYLHMLVLSRKKNERIVIGDNIVITVVEVRGDRVRLGIEAPQEVSIHRSEVHAAIQQEQSEKDSAAKPSAEVSTHDD